MDSRHAGSVVSDSRPALPTSIDVRSLRSLFVGFSSRWAVLSVLRIAGTCVPSAALHGMWACIRCLEDAPAQYRRSAPMAGRFV